MATVTIKNLTKTYNNVVCLNQVNLEVAHGEMVVVVGPSGCGKTTLLRCIAGLEEVDSGYIYIDGELVNDKEPIDRDVAMVFQYYSLYPHMIVRNNLSFGLEHTTKLSKNEIKARVDEVAKILKISQLMDRKPSQLSGGEAQRVAIGRALVRKPKIIFFDEPLSAVDAKLRRELRAEIKKIQRNFELTGMYVTHDQEEAMAVADKLVVLGIRQLHQVGTPDEVFNQPRDRFVASFIGKPTMNFFDLEVSGSDGNFLLQSNDLTLKISNSFYKRYLSGYHGKKVSAGIRPSSFSITRPTDTVLSGNPVTASVVAIENMGDEYHIHCKAGGTKITAKTTAGKPPDIGEKIFLGFDEAEVHLFDVESGQSLKL